MKNTASAKKDNLADMFQMINGDNYKIILSGETHSIANTYIFRFELIKYLHKNYGYRYVLDELGFADTQYLNLYLDTGDEKMLTTGYSRYLENERFEYLKKLHEYNRSLPEQEGRKNGIRTCDRGLWFGEFRRRR